MTPTQYVTEFSNFVTTRGFLPICVQATGDDADSATFAAIFQKNETLTNVAGPQPCYLEPSTDKNVLQDGKDLFPHYGMPSL